MTLFTFLSVWLPPVAWCGLIFYLSSIPGLNSGLRYDFILRKMAHITEYAVLTGLLWRALRRTWNALTPAGVGALSGLLALAYAASDEFHQMFVPRRGPSIHDVVIDSVGIIAAIWILRRQRPRGEKLVFRAKNLLVFLAVVAVASGCGPEAAIKSARRSEAKGKPYDAWQKYQEFAARYPKHAAAPEALFRAGWLAETSLGDCAVAKTFYQRVEHDYASSDPWAAMASFNADNCPDFFPLVPGNAWVEGDSESGGKNARIESTCRASTGTAKVPFSSGVIVRDYFGGSSKFKTTETFYAKEGASVWEHSDGSAPRLVIKGPVETGTTWMSDVGGRRFRFEIVSSSATI
ncbi:MAG: VanZ family protein, partial [Elusimicrobia bacterium]|nr:VanZ family protein [Elusimicrobiota bacterium]